MKKPLKPTHDFRNENISEDYETNAPQSLNRGDSYRDRSESSASQYQMEIRRSSISGLDTQCLNGLQEPKLYRYRWVILILYLLSDLIPSTIVTTTTPIASQISSIYALHPIEVNLSSLVILIAAPLATYFSSKYLDEKGLCSSIRIGTVICTAGAWMRVLVNQSFYFVVAGNFLTGLGAPFICNGKSQVSFNWFSHQQGPGVTSFISFWVNLNAIAGFVLSGNFLSDYRFDIASVNEGKELVWSLMILIALGVTGIMVIVWIFFKKNPPTPPSFAAQEEREQDFSESVKKLFKNRNYILLIFQQGLFLGSISGLATSVSFFIKPFGFNSSDSTIMLGAIPVGGIIGTIIGSYFLNKYKRYKLHMGIYAIGGACGLSLFLLTLYSKNIFLTLIGTSVMGLFFIPMIPALLEFSCESVFPIGEGSTVGILSGASSLSALLYGLVMSFIVKGESTAQTAAGTLFMICSFGIGFFLLSLTKENLVRHEIETLRSSQFSNTCNTGGIQLQTFVQLQEVVPTTSQNEQEQSNVAAVVVHQNIKHETAPQPKPFSENNSYSQNTNNQHLQINIEVKEKPMQDRTESLSSTASSANHNTRSCTQPSGFGSPSFEIPPFELAHYLSPDAEQKPTEFQPKEKFCYQSSIQDSAI